MIMKRTVKKVRRRKIKMLQQKLRLRQLVGSDSDSIRLNSISIGIIIIIKVCSLPNNDYLSNTERSDQG